jgi:hypothetical protein
MTEKEYRDALNPYQYFYGKDLYLVSHEKVPADRVWPKDASADPSGNGIIYRCMDMLILKQNGWLTGNDVRAFYAMINLCMVKEYGLVQRSPNKHDLQSHDDLTFLMYTCKELELSSLIIGIYSYCQKKTRGPWWYPLPLTFVYNTETPGNYYTPSGANAWLGRFFNLRAHFKFCMGLKPTVIENLVWNMAVDNSLNSDLDDHTSWLLTFALVNSAPESKKEYKEKWEAAYVAKFKTEHWMKEDGLFANSVQTDHPLGLFFRWSKR